MTIRDEERDVAVLLSAEDYQKLIRREAVEELKQLCVRVGSRAAASGLTDDKLSELLGEDD